MRHGNTSQFNCCIECKYTFIIICTPFVWPICQYGYASKLYPSAIISGFLGYFKSSFKSLKFGFTTIVTDWLRSSKHAILIGFFGRRLNIVYKSISLVWIWSLSIFKQQKRCYELNIFRISKCSASSSSVERYLFTLFRLFVCVSTKWNVI